MADTELVLGDVWIISLVIPRHTRPPQWGNSPTDVTLA